MQMDKIKEINVATPVLLFCKPYQITFYVFTPCLSMYAIFSRLGDANISGCSIFFMQIISLLKINLERTNAALTRP